MKTIVVFLSIVLSATFLYAGNGDLIVNGNIGVGTSPANRVHVSGASPSIHMQNTTGTAGSGSSLIFGHLQGDSDPVARIYSYLTNGGTGAHAGNLVFQTAIGGVLADRMTILSSGNVGIGTPAPSSTLSVVGSQTYTTTGNVAALYVKGTADSPMNLTLDAAGTTDNTPRIRFLNNGATKWQIVAGDTLEFQKDVTGAGGWNAGFAMPRETGNLHLGGISTTTGGARSIVLRNGSKPTAIYNSAGLYAQDVSGTSELFSFDQAGNVTQQTAHAQDAPEALYDLEDGLPMIVKEVQYFLGYVRYTNHTRLARMAGMTDAEKASLSPARRTCVIKENFAEHEARTGEKLTLLVWEEEQAAIKARCDSERQKVIDQANLLTAAIANKTSTVAASKSQSAAAVENELAQLKAQQATLTIPEEYVIEPIPERIRAALGQQ